MKSLYLTFGVIVIGLAMFSYAEAWGGDWKFYSETDLFISYDDKETISCPSKNIIGVWMKEVNTEEQQGSSKFSWSLKMVTKRLESKVLKNLTWRIYNQNWSGRGDLNSRLLGPEPSALPGCATPRLSLNLSYSKQNVKCPFFICAPKSVLGNRFGKHHGGELCQRGLGRF